MTPVDPAWPRLGQLVRERREALRISQGAAGVSVATWRKVEHAVDPPYRRSTLLAIERVLLWAPGSIDRILDGADPIDLDPRGVAPTSQSVEKRLDELEAEIRRLRERLRPRSEDH